VTVVDFWQSHLAELLALTTRHVVLVVISTVVAIAIGVPIGIVAARRPRIGGPMAAAASVIQTVPSLALFGFLLPLPLIGGVGASTALVALILYALLPLIRTTAAGLRSIDAAILEAADALGMTPRERLVRVELPLALPSIIAGIRVAAVFGVGTVTIAAAIGAGGLGEYIYRGLATIDSTVILAGAIPVAVLALTVDGLLFLIERTLSARRRRRGPLLAATAAIVAIAAGAGALGLSSGDRVVVGSKNFSEQVILGELMAQALERYGGLEVERRLNLGGTFICDRALTAGDIDLYVEYTGTALTAVFKQPVERDPRRVLERVRMLYAESDRTLLEPLGFNNTFAILVRSADARDLGLTTLSQLAPVAPKMRAAFGFEFLEREDGYKGLAATYGLRFAGPPRVMDLTLMYRALAERQVDVVAGDATAGLIDALKLTVLEDDRQYFPPYDAVPVVRSAAMARRPEIRNALARLQGKVSAAAMRRMNYAVDAERRDPADVAREFLNALDGGV
jgi:osmoprotectant transport system permease protein